MVKPEISILVCGMTGVGKSTLVNYILGEDVCSVGDAVNYVDAPEDAFGPQTVKIQGHYGVIRREVKAKGIESIDTNGVKVRIYDSPGLQDGTNHDQQYVDDMYEKCRGVDLVLYCHDITRVRWADSEEKCISLLTEKFRSAFWNKAILVLTKANLLQPPRRKDDPKEYLEKMIKVNGDKFRSDLSKVLQDKGSDMCAAGNDLSNIAKSLPVVPAGSERQEILRTGPFIGDLWMTCMERLPVEKTGIFMKATNFIKRVVPMNAGESVPIPTHERRYLLYIDMKRFTKLAEKCKNVISVIWKRVKIELSVFIPPGD